MKLPPFIEFEVLQSTPIKLFPGLFPSSPQAITLFLPHFNIIVLYACLLLSFIIIVILGKRLQIRSYHYAGLLSSILLFLRLKADCCYTNVKKI
jgi:hypothetical protein